MILKKQVWLIEEGFTLLEVLVALTVSGVLFTVILSGFGANLNNTSIAEGYTTASFLVKEIMTDLENEKKMRIGKREGDFGEDYPGFRWEAYIKEDSVYPFYAATLKVIFYRRGVEREMVVRSVFLEKPEDESSAKL